MKQTLVPIPENKPLSIFTNIKQKKTPRVKNTQHTEFDYIMINNVSNQKTNKAFNSLNINIKDNIESVSSSHSFFKEILVNKEKIFTIMNDVFDSFHVENTNNIKKNMSSINSKEIIDNIKYCFIHIHHHIENEKKHLSVYDISSNKADTIMTNHLNKPKQPRIDTILEIKKKELGPKMIDPYEIIYRK
jgi:hypothetical protein